MKFRFDFVSNSSSCSFVINDLTAFNEKLKVLSSTKDGNDIDTFWMFDLEIRFNFKNTEDNKNVFEDFTDRYTYTDDEWIYGSGDFEKFLQIDPHYYDQLGRVEVYVYDDCGNEGVQKLTLLYWAMRAEGVDVDNSESEHEYELFHDVPTQLVNAAVKMFQPKQELN